LQRGVGLFAQFQRFHIATMDREEFPCNAEQYFRPGNFCNLCPVFPELGQPGNLPNARYARFREDADSWRESL
jgi:hypothetical protein